jgi:16S rRNA (cytosine1402-N4)-methyltransferase
MQTQRLDQIMNIEPTVHQAVMLEEAISALNIKSDGIYLDATYGRGGHTRAILARLGPKAKLLVMDKDPQAIADALLLAASDPRVEVFAGSFSEISNFCTQKNVMQRVDGILFDLGVSSPQLDESERGFSFMREGPLDMRMDPTTGVSVAQWLATAKENDIAQVLKDLGEEKFSKRVANAIITYRQNNPIITTRQLANIVSEAIPFKEKNKHPATRSFQALRIFINRELEDLSAALAQVLAVLAPFGRLAVISFHSLEDRIVKQFIAQQARGDDFPQRMPIKHLDLKPKLRSIGKAIKPTDQEINFNVRARSAVLRVAEKLAGGAND